MGGGGGKVPERQTTVTEPPSFMIPYIRQLLGEADYLYRNQPLQYFPGETVAGFNPAELAAQQSALQTAGNLEGQNAQLQQSLQYGLNGAMDVRNNPYFQSAVQAAINPIKWNLQDEILPGVASGAGGAGQYGGTRQGIAEGLAISRANQQMVDAAARMGSDAYNQGQETYIRSLALAPTLQQSQMLPIQLRGQVGQQIRDYQQALIDSQIDRFNFEQNEPYNRLGLYQNFIGGQYGGQSTSTGHAAQASSGQRLAGAAAAGLGTYGMMSAIPAMGPFAPYAAAGMAILSLMNS